MRARRSWNGVVGVGCHFSQCLLVVDPASVVLWFRQGSVCGRGGGRRENPRGVNERGFVFALVHYGVRTLVEYLTCVQFCFFYGSADPPLHPHPSPYLHTLLIPNPNHNRSPKTHPNPHPNPSTPASAPTLTPTPTPTSTPTPTPSDDRLIRVAGGRGVHQRRFPQAGRTHTGQAASLRSGVRCSHHRGRGYVLRKRNIARDSRLRLRRITTRCSLREI